MFSKYYKITVICATLVISLIIFSIIGTIHNMPMNPAKAEESTQLVYKGTNHSIYMKRVSTYDRTFYVVWQEENSTKDIVDIKVSN